MRFGLIPELVGRLPVITSLESLDEEALVRILCEPKNSMVRQYRHLFELDHVELEFEDDALRAIAKKAIERKTGARGLRGILEETLGRLMYEIPSDPTVERVVITADAVNHAGEALVLHDPNRAELPAASPAAAKKIPPRTSSAS